MGIAARHKSRIEFGDFQTPHELARRVTERVRAAGFLPAAIVEPSCGAGTLLFAAADAFDSYTHALGLEIQPVHRQAAEAARLGREDARQVVVEEGDFFAVDWRAKLATLPDPLLAIGNPPWVTNAELASIGSRNVPLKSNFQGRAGLDALTGKANFDISEAMLLRLVAVLAERDSMLAMLCKTAVARKVLEHAWKMGTKISAAEMCRIDSMSHFGASVDACLLVIRFGLPIGPSECRVFSSLDANAHDHTIGFREHRVVADARCHDRWQHLQGKGPYRWRSGIKHDCAEVMELVGSAGSLRTRHGQPVDLEPDIVFPMLKASHLGSGNVREMPRWMIVPQRTIGEDTSRLARLAPKTWAYLTAHAERLDRRASVIYRGRPRFSVFGVGEYSFTPWKVAVAGLYKTLAFRVVGPRDGRPVVFDDTCNFIACKGEAEARMVADMLNSDPSREFYSAFIFWDAKRPVTIDVLERLDVTKLAQMLGCLPDLLMARDEARLEGPADATGSLFPP